MNIDNLAIFDEFYRRQTHPAILILKLKFRVLADIGPVDK